MFVSIHINYTLHINNCRIHIICLITWLLKQVTVMCVLTAGLEFNVEWDVIRLLHFKDSPAGQTEGLTFSAIKSINCICPDEIKPSSNNTGLSLLINESFVLSSQLISHWEIPSITNTQKEFRHFLMVKAVIVCIYTSVKFLTHFISVLLLY